MATVMRFETLNKPPPRDSGLRRLRGHRNRHRAFTAGPESRKNEPAALYRKAYKAIEKIAMRATNATPTVRPTLPPGAAVRPRLEETSPTMNPAHFLTCFCA